MLFSVMRSSFSLKWIQITESSGDWENCLVNIIDKKMYALTSLVTFNCQLKYPK